MLGLGILDSKDADPSLKSGFEIKGPLSEGQKVKIFDPDTKSKIKPIQALIESIENFSNSLSCLKVDREVDKENTDKDPLTHTDRVNTIGEKSSQSAKRHVIFGKEAFVSKEVPSSYSTLFSSSTRDSEETTRSNASKYKKIFDKNILSPSFNDCLNNILKDSNKNGCSTPCETQYHSMCDNSANQSKNVVSSDESSKAPLQDVTNSYKQVSQPKAMMTKGSKILTFRTFGGNSKENAPVQRIHAQQNVNQTSKRGKIFGEN